MSGILGIVRFDGTPVDGQLLRRMTDAMAIRGPDAQEIWIDGPVGLGHALLQTTDGAEDRRQPATLDGRVWITADARVDGRGDLVRRLEARGRHDLRRASDAQLILHAYHAWGEQCVEHLLGDFAFGIWDGSKRSLFCARDHFGVKPFYYARMRGGIVFSNTLDCLRLHPGVGDALNEAAIGDFLLFGSNQDPGTTVFADIDRLVPGHTLTCTEDAYRSRRYWMVPNGGRIRYRRSNEYVDHFREVLREAVRDRLRSSHVDVWMSGGIDSTSITAVAHQLLSEREAPFDLRARTTVYDTLIADDERYYAGLAANALGVPASYLAADEYKPFEGWGHADLRTPEPTNDPYLLLRRQQLKDVAAHSRVLLSGEGGDEVLWGSHVVEVFGRMPLLRLGADVARSLGVFGRRPGLGLRARLGQWRGHGRERPPYPAWLNTAFAERLDLRARYEQVMSARPILEHPLRAEAHRRLVTAPWAWYFESSDPGVTGISVEPRYPFLDVRVVNYLLALPPFPWFIDKLLLREAMRGTLPDAVRVRPKTPLREDPLRAHLRRGPDACWRPLEAAAELGRCVDARAVDGAAGGCDTQDPWLEIRPLCLNYWFKHVHTCAP